ncbi:MAG: hypothetical protein ABW137_15365 [Mycobacterium sp.]
MGSRVAEVLLRCRGRRERAALDPFGVNGFDRTVAQIAQSL